MIVNVGSDANIFYGLSCIAAIGLLLRRTLLRSYRY